VNLEAAEKVTDRLMKIVVKWRLNAGQILVKYRSNTVQQRDGLEVKYWSNTGQGRDGLETAKGDRLPNPVGDIYHQ
jgi:hypothetical protein